MRRSFGLALHQPPGRDAGPSAYDFGDVLGGDLLGDHPALGSGLGFQLRSSSGSSPYWILAACSRSRRAPPDRRCCVVHRCGSSGRRCGRGWPSPGPTGNAERAVPPRDPRGRRAVSPTVRPKRSVSLARAISSIFMRSTWRWSLSISSGLESISMRSREADSSTRSMALSGRKRAVM